MSAKLWFQTSMVPFQLRGSHYCNYRIMYQDHLLFHTLPKPAEAETKEPSPSHHPWPEWLHLMDTLSKEGYFHGCPNPFLTSQLAPKDANTVRTASLNFARDRPHIIRYLSMNHIKVIAECGCPTIDRKVVNSGKRLRSYVGINERNPSGILEEEDVKKEATDISYSCSLRGNCERAFVEAREDDGGRTVDVMRILVTYGLNPIFGGIENKHCVNIMVEESVRDLLKQMVKHGTHVLSSNLSKPTIVDESFVTNSANDDRLNVQKKQGDWDCPKCHFLNFARNIRCLRCDGLFEERLKQVREERENLPLKKGDWICEKCNFLNFAKNTRCLLCKEKPPKRLLNPGEWECDSCNYINFRRNSVCLKCGHRRPKASRNSNSSQLDDENAGHHNDHQVHKQPNGVDRWRFVEEEEADDSSSANWSFVDFPIEGGKSDLSHNAQERHMWMLKMQKRHQKLLGGSESAKGAQSSNCSKSKDYSGSDGDEEMAEWFGHVKVRTQ